MPLKATSNHNAALRGGIKESIMTITNLFRKDFKNGKSAYRPTYERNELELLSELVSIRRFAERAGIRNAATMLRRQGMPMIAAEAVLLYPMFDALHALNDYQNRMNEMFDYIVDKAKRG